jgi:hypothetical protein
VSWEMARVSTAVRVKKPRDKRLCFMGLCWLGCYQQMMPLTRYGS